MLVALMPAHREVQCTDRVLAVQCSAEMGRQRRWRLERRKKAAAAAAAARREREKNAPRDAESTSDGAIAN